MNWPDGFVGSFVAVRTVRTMSISCAMLDGFARVNDTIPCGADVCDSASEWSPMVIVIDDGLAAGCVVVVGFVAADAALNAAKVKSSVDATIVANETRRCLMTFSVLTYVARVVRYWSAAVTSRASAVVSGGGGGIMGWSSGK